MSTWSVIVTIGGTPTDITSLVVVPSIVRSTRLHTEMRANVNRCDFRAQFSSTLWASLVTASDVYVAITKDAAAYFTGVLSPNYQADIVDGRKYLDLIAEDYTLAKLGTTIPDVTTYAGFAVSTPSATATSLLHTIATAAGVTLTAGAPTITTVVPYVCVLPDDKTTWGQLLGDILFEVGYVYYFAEAGTLTLVPMVNSGNVTTTNTFAVGTNVLDRITAKKSPDKYDDIRVKFATVESQAGLVLFEDTSGGEPPQDCKITLDATGDGAGKDYYPPNSGTVEVFSEWSNPDGKEIWIATSAALASDNIIPADTTLSRAFTNYYRRCSFAYHNAAAATREINRLRVTGTAYVVTARNVARSSLTGGKVLLEMEAKYVFTEALASVIANLVNQYYAYSDFTYSLKSKSDFALGEYVQLTDATYSGISQKCRVIGKKDTGENDVTAYDLEAVADYASITITTEGTGKPVSSQIGRIIGYQLKPRTIYKRSMVIPAAPSGSAPSGWQEFPPGGAETLWASDGWMYANGAAIADALMSASLLMGTGLRMWASTWSAPRQVIETSEMQTPRYLGKYLAAHPSAITRKPGDWWTVYDTDDTPINRGVWQDVAGTPAQITDDVGANARILAAAMHDILWATKQGTYGVITDYANITFIANLAAEVAFIEQLFAQVIEIKTGGKIYSGAGNYANADTGLFLDYLGRFSLKDKLTWDGTTLAIIGGGTFSGALSAATGTFGEVSIYSGGSLRAGARYNAAGTDLGSGVGAWLGASGVLKAREAILSYATADHLSASDADLTDSGTYPLFHIDSAAQLIEIQATGNGSIASPTSGAKKITIDQTSSGPKISFKYYNGSSWATLYYFDYASGALLAGTVTADQVYATNGLYGESLSAASTSWETVSTIQIAESAITFVSGVYNHSGADKAFSFTLRTKANGAGDGIRSAYSDIDDEGASFDVTKVIQITGYPYTIQIRRDTTANCRTKANCFRLS